MSNPQPSVIRGLARYIVSFAFAAACYHKPVPDTGVDQAGGRGTDSTRSAQTQRGRSSATQSVDFEEVERTKYTRVEQMIQARFAGVQVIQTGGSYAIQIRGNGSFGSSNEPLIIIDGGPKTIADLGRISTREVVRIEVMKDGAASFYGSRGANGVIVITTRQSAP